jgi:hypothetical protein
MRNTLKLQNLPNFPKPLQKKPTFLRNPEYNRTIITKVGFFRLTYYKPRSPRADQFQPPEVKRVTKVQLRELYWDNLMLLVLGFLQGPVPMSE